MKVFGGFGPVFMLQCINPRSVWRERKREREREGERERERERERFVTAT